MPIILKILGSVVGIAAAVLLLSWVGLKIVPQPFPAYTGESPQTIATMPLPDDLPAPVRRYYQAIIGDDIPIITSSVIDSQVIMRMMGITLNGNFRFTHDAGHGYRHYIESTIYGLPLLKVNELYVDGVGIMELPFGTISDEPKTNTAANLGLWGESVWLPSVFITDERVRWEAIDDTSARLIVPFEGNGPEDFGNEDVFTVYFDPTTGLITRLETMRWKDEADTEKTAWILDVQGWATFDGVMIPSPASVTWGNEDSPWLVVTITDVSHNTDVSEYIRQRGL